MGACVGASHPECWVRCPELSVVPGQELLSWSEDKRSTFLHHCWEETKGVFIGNER